MQISEPTHPHTKSRQPMFHNSNANVLKLNSFSHQYTAIIYVSIHIYNCISIYIYIISYPYPIYPHIFHSHTFFCAPKTSEKNKPSEGRTLARSKATTFWKFAFWRNLVCQNLENPCSSHQNSWVKMDVNIPLKMVLTGIDTYPFDPYFGRFY